MSARPPLLKDLPATGWTRVPVERLWPEVLFPLLDSSAVLQRLLECCVDSWILHEMPKSMRPELPWRYDDLAAEAPFMMTLSDGAVTFVDERIFNTSEDFEHPLFEAAMLFKAIQTVLYSEASDVVGPLPEAMMEELGRRENDLYRRFTPQRATDVRWCRPMHSCHTFAPFAWGLALAWNPTANWQVISSTRHTTVIDFSTLHVFDLLVLDDGATAGDDIIAFTKGTGPFTNEVRRTKRRLQRARGRRASMEGLSVTGDAV